MPEVHLHVPGARPSSRRSFAVFKDLVPEPDLDELATDTDLEPAVT